MLKKFERPQESKEYDYARTLDSYKAEMMKSLDDKAETKEFIQSLIKEQDDQGFWSLIPSTKVDSDIRVAYWYEPTYIATTVMMRFYMENKAEAEKIDGFEKALTKGLEASAGRGLKGHGHDDIKGRLDALNIFSKGRVLEFVERYPDLSPEFGTMIALIHKWLNNALISGKTKGGWGEDYKDDMYKTLNALGAYSGEDIKVFVYGTLMKGRSNFERFLPHAEFLGCCTAVDFALYDLGSFPGVVYSKGDKVKGELYKINREILKSLDRLEGEGSLYLRLFTNAVDENDNTEPAYIYVYNHDVSGKERISLENQPWGRAKDVNLVWYACYGSNINKDRFMKYIDGCQDKTAPIAEKPMTIDHPIYFANKSSRWNSQGVAFLDMSQGGKCYGKRYLITREQFERIHELEGQGSKWYNTVVDLGSEAGILIKTITHAPRQPEDVLPSIGYLEVIKKGIQDTYPVMAKADVEAYLIERFLKKEDSRALPVIRSQDHGVTIQRIAEEMKLDMSSFLESIFALKETGLIRQDGRSVRAGTAWEAACAVYYTVPEKREAIDRVISNRTR